MIPSRRRPRSLSARVTIYTRQRAHVYVSRGAQFRWPRLLPFISTSFVDSIETWYITRRASQRVNILSMHKYLKCNAHKMNLFEKKRRRTNDECQHRKKNGERNGSSKTHSIILNVIMLNNEEANDDRRTVRYSIQIPDWRIVSSAAVLSIRFMYSTRIRMRKTIRQTVIEENWYVIYTCEMCDEHDHFCFNDRRVSIEWSLSSASIGSTIY